MPKKKKQEVKKEITTAPVNRSVWWKDRMAKLEAENEELKNRVLMLEDQQEGEQNTEVLPEPAAYLYLQARLFHQRIGALRAHQVFRSIRDQDGNIWTCGIKQAYVDDEGYHPAEIHIICEPNAMRAHSLRSERARLIEKIGGIKNRLARLGASVRLETLRKMVENTGNEELEAIKIEYESARERIRTIDAIYERGDLEKRIYRLSADDPIVVKVWESSRMTSEEQKPKEMSSMSLTTSSG